MYIKQVLIEGFKSYRELVAPEPFSPKVNCVVGANGSGKSNFFFAIRFVLSDLFQNMRQEDRQSLLHEGTGGQVLSAFVEIVFDNSDNRIPVDKEEVRLRRTIGMRKDEYWLDKKHITKTEVMNLLESAGFSRSNPYYVVQQGKITSLSLMKDAERLNLLKEIGGARVYEERRKESLKLMDDAAARRRQIEDVVSYIEERLRELDAEKEELKKYQTLDKQRRAMEYTIFDKEQNEAKEQLDKIEAKRIEAQQNSGEQHNRAQERHEELKTVEKQLKALAQERQALAADKDAAERQRAEAVQRHTRLELDARELSDKTYRDQAMKEQVERELSELEESIAESNTLLESAQGDLEEAQRREAEVSESLESKTKQLEGLYQKQGRRTTFSSKQERNRWLQSSVNSIQDVIAQKTQQVTTLDAEIAQLREGVTGVEDAQEAKQQDVQRVQGELRQCQQEIAAQQRVRDALSVDRKKLMKEEAEYSQAMRQLQEDHVHANSMLQKSAPRDIRRGLDTLRRIAHEHNMTGVHGPLLELIDCDEQFQTAVEVTAGNSLYNVVVDDDRIAARLVHYLNLEKGGRITFIPLNKATAPNLNYPEDDDVSPLINKIRFDPQFNRAFQQVFGRTLLCKDINVAADFARNGDFDCITFEGSRVERKGAMTGGHYDAKRSKLRLMHQLKSARGQLQELEDKRTTATHEANDLDQRITQSLGELEKLKGQQSHLKTQLEQLRVDDRDLRNELASTKSQLAGKEKTVEAIRESIQKAEGEMREKQAEMQADFGAGLTAEEQRLMARLPGEIEQQKKDQLACRKRRMQAEATIGNIETALTENLLRRQDELQGQLDTLKMATGVSSQGTLETEVDIAREAMEEARREHKRVADRVAQVEAEIRKLKMKKEDLKREEEGDERRLQDEGKVLEQLLNERNVLNHKRDELNKKIRDLGVLPQDAFDKYQKFGLKELHRMLHRCNESLKQFSHVNKKALDQYTSFTEQREEMHRRQAEVDQSDAKIKELIEVLDQRKDEALERTFKQVARNFRETFAELVPGGHGSLVMIRKKTDGDAGADDDDDADEEGRREAEAEGRVDKYSGVRVKVSFTGRGETQSMKQLSGGQKTVVALCLIFAIQRCDPAPFYLFDEIDQALDAQYRSAVANMIRKQADTSSTQFILTTFRPELVKVADSVYSVEHRNRVSTVRVVNQEAGLRFVEADQGAQAART